MCVVDDHCKPYEDEEGDGDQSDDQPCPLSVRGANEQLELLTSAAFVVIIATKATSHIETRNQRTGECTRISCDRTASRSNLHAGERVHRRNFIACGSVHAVGGLPPVTWLSVIYAAKKKPNNPKLLMKVRRLEVHVVLFRFCSYLPSFGKLLPENTSRTSHRNEHQKKRVIAEVSE